MYAHTHAQKEFTQEHWETVAPSLWSSAGHWCDHRGIKIHMKSIMRREEEQQSHIIPQYKGAFYIELKGCIIIIAAAESTDTESTEAQQDIIIIPNR